MKVRTYEPSCPSIAALESLSLIPHCDSGSCVFFLYVMKPYIRPPYLPQELHLVSSLFPCQVSNESIGDSKIIGKRPQGVPDPRFVGYRIYRGEFAIRIIDMCMMIACENTALLLLVYRRPHKSNEALPVRVPIPNHRSDFLAQRRTLSTGHWVLVL